MPVLKIKKNGSWIEVWGSTGDGFGQSFVIEDIDGNTFTGIVVDEVTVLTATAEDVKEGKTAGTESGIVVGTHVCD